MKIVHFSDWHGDWQPLPTADIYVCTGDMYPNFPDILFKSRDGDEHWICAPSEGLPSVLWIDGKGFSYALERRVIPTREETLQREWARANPITPFLGDREAPVVCVRGNHDFAPLSLLFAGMREVYEVDDPTETFDVLGLKFGGVRGIPYIIGEWSDELEFSEMGDRMANVPNDVDVLVTHAPPERVLDLCGNMHIGCPAIAGYVTTRQYYERPLLAHMFGHNHRPEVVVHGETQFSNAATSFNTVHVL